MYPDKEKGEIVFTNEDIVQMLTPMMNAIAEKNRELHDLNIVPKTILIPIEEMRIFGLRVKTKQ